MRAQTVPKYKSLQIQRGVSEIVPIGLDAGWSITVHLHADGGKLAVDDVTVENAPKTTECDQGFALHLA